MPRHRSATAVFRLALIGIVSWVVGGSGIAGAQSFTEYAVTTAGGMPAGITFGPDGNHWYTEEAGNKIATITPSDGVHEFPALPLNNLSQATNPLVIVLPPMTTNSGLQ
jgi:streptogramin lyase